MNKKFLNGLKAIQNTLSGNAREFADEVVKAFEALEADTAEHDVTALKDEIDKIAAKFAEQDQAVAEKIAKVRESIMGEIRKNTASMKDKFTADVKKEIANALMSKKYKQDAIDAVMAVAKRNDIAGLTFPEIVDYALELKIDEGDFFFENLRKTQRNKFFYGEIDHTDPEQIAKQWDKGSVTAKEVQALVLEGKKIDTKYIYKRQRLAQEDYDASEEAGALASLQRDLRQELRTMVEVGVTRAILIGDTVNPVGQRINTFETIGTKTATDMFTTVLNPEVAGTITVVDLARAAAAVKTERKWLVMSSNSLLELRQFVYGQGGTVTLKSLEDLAAEVGVERIIRKDYLDGVDGLHAIVLDPDEYWVKEVKTLDLVYPEYDKNAIVFQYERNMGGAIHGVQSTAVLREAQA
jgi:hypothetical protein